MGILTEYPGPNEQKTEAEKLKTLVEHVDNLTGKLVELEARLEKIERALGEPKRSHNIDSLPVTDERTLRILHEYEQRGIVELIMKHGLPPRLPNECPKCRAKGGLTEIEEFKRSIVWHFNCPSCGNRWVAQLRTSQEVGGIKHE